MTMPFWATLFSIFVTGESITLRELTFMVICFLSVILISVTNAKNQAKEDADNS